MFWFIVLLLVAGAGFYFYQKLTTIEREIRAEQAAERGRATASSATVPAQEPEPEVKEVEPVPEPEVAVELEAVDREPTIAETPVADEFASPEEEILAAVKNLPGIKQIELYKSFPDFDKKKFQQMVKQLADDGDITREKQGSSYILFPA